MAFQVAPKFAGFDKGRVNLSIVHDSGLSLD